MDTKLKEKRLGETQVNNQGLLMTIVIYRTANDIDIQFEDGTIVKHRTYEKFKKQHNIINPNYPSVYGVGYLGQGKYSSSNGTQHTDAYTKWKNCLQRVYSGKNKAYENCEVCEEWHNFQNFAKWYEENYYEIDGEKMCLDKDILVHNNKIYSPQTCIIVPERINQLFVKNKEYRNGLPIGVVFDKKLNKYVGQMNMFNNTIRKEFNTTEEAFYFYKTVKESYIKEIADEYKPYIPQKLYDAMYRYEVDIND